MKKAFTLVELLIVITLIAILSVAVLATINPIEQTNKARDAQFKNDAAEVLSAYERYFASQNAYPWNVSVGTGVTVSPGSAAHFAGNTPTFGVVGSSFDANGIGTTDSELIKTSELKPTFLGKAPFKQSPKNGDMMWASTDGADSNYVCFFPKAKANRTGEMGKKLKCLNPTTHLISPQNTTCILSNVWNETDMQPSATVANLMCVPE